MKLSKRLGSVIIALAMLASSMSAFACANDQFVAYDQIGEEAMVNGKLETVYSKLFFCPEKDTIVKKGVAETAEWKTVFYEAEYPHKRIEALFLDGTNTGLTRWNENWAQPYAIVNTKEVPEFWEAKVPYFVYNRIYSDFTGKFEPTNTLTTNYKSAPVAKEWNKVGFENIVVENGVAKDYTLVYAANEDQVAIEYNLDKLADEYNAKIAAGVSYEEASKVFDKAIKNVSWLKLTGPDYVTGGNMEVVPMAKIAAGADATWYDDLLAVSTPATKNNKDLNKSYQSEYADVEWVTVGYELEAPYRYYQVLSVNGVLMDGSEIELVGSTVDKLETIDTIDEQFAIQLVKKDTELAKYEYSVENDYVVSPFDTTRYTTINEKATYEVVESPISVTETADATAFDGNYLDLAGRPAFEDDNAASTPVTDVQYDRNLRETVYETIVTPTGEEYEVRLAKVVREPGKSKLPYIYRYEGFAQPTVEWKVAFAERAYPYEIYEEKFVDGIATGEYRTTGKYAEPKVALSQVLGQPRVLTVKLADTTDRTKLEWALEDVGFPYIIGGQSVTVIVPAEVYDGYYQFGDIDHDFQEFVKVFTKEVKDDFPMENLQ